MKLEGNPDYPMSHGSMCAKGLAGISALYHPNRNKYPLMRVGKRGENKWKRISWKEAIDTIAGKMEEVRREYGAESVLFSTGGGGNPAFRGIPRVANAFGTPNFYEPGCAQCFLPRTLAYHMMYGGPTTSIADEQVPRASRRSRSTRALCPMPPRPTSGFRSVQAPTWRLCSAGPSTSWRRICTIMNS